MQYLQVSVLATRQMFVRQILPQMKNSGLFFFVRFCVMSPMFGYNRVLTKSAPNPYATPCVARTKAIRVKVLANTLDGLIAWRP